MDLDGDVFCSLQAAFKTIQKSATNIQQIGFKPINDFIQFLLQMYIHLPTYQDGTLWQPAASLIRPCYRDVQLSNIPKMIGIYIYQYYKISKITPVYIYTHIYINTIEHSSSVKLACQVRQVAEPGTITKPSFGVNYLGHSFPVPSEPCASIS